MVQNIQQLGLGFSDGQIQQALKQHQYDEARATNYLLEVMSQPQAQPQQQVPQSTHSNPYQAAQADQNPAASFHQPQNQPQQQNRQLQHAQSSGDDQLLMDAIQASLKAEPLALDKRQRQEGVPVGLKNVGNTCYFNSFIQAFFFLPNMSEKVLANAIRRQSQQQQQKFGEMNEKSQMKAKRMDFSLKMAHELQYLFARLLYTNQSYVDPSDVLNNVVDDSGYPCPVGDQ